MGQIEQPLEQVKQTMMAKREGVIAQAAAGIDGSCRTRFKRLRPSRTD